MQNKEFKISTIFDTETCNYGVGADTRAYPILWIFNDVRGVDLFEYEPEIDDTVIFFRHQTEALEYIVSLVNDGLNNSYIPIVCAYNLMFDLQGLMFDLNERYKMRANAQSATNAYTVDIVDDNDNVLLRFWDTFHLENRGLSAMGRTCGLAKATGDWDYSLVRTPETPLTDEELYYAARDVQVIPAYFKYLLHANSWMEQKDLGVRVLTKTSIVRQMAAREIGNLKYKNSKGKQVHLDWAHNRTCLQQLPPTYEQYALRKACFRGGFTFTAGTFASKCIKNVLSVDVTSMHHAFINGRSVPLNFYKKAPDALQVYLENIVNTPLSEVLRRYDKPFLHAVHARIQFTNLRLRKDSAFERWNIALIPQAKFIKEVFKGTTYGFDERAVEAEKIIRERGFYDRAYNYVFAFGKLMSAEKCVLHLNEIELYAISLVYEWDEMRVIFGEGTQRWSLPPDFVTLQSNVLFETKQHAKTITKHYTQGEPYPLEIPDTIPENIAEQLYSGSCTNQFFESYYNSTVKGMFNGIYGTQAQDIYKPSYAVEDGELFVDRSTAVTPENFTNADKNNCKVLYTYGMRIVGGSRLHLVIAIKLLHDYFGSRVDVVGGDTDSMKVRVDADVTDDEIMKALEPLHNAIDNAIAKTMRRVRDTFPAKASQLTGVGNFEVENNGERYAHHMEGWNKARLSVGADGSAHITCAGLSRPDGAYHIETFVEELLKRGIPFEDIAPNVIGYNIYVSHDICHALQKHRPLASERFHETVTDYLGNTCVVDEPEAISLYPVGRYLGETTKPANELTVKWLRNFGTKVNTQEKTLEVVNGKAEITLMS